MHTNITSGELRAQLPEGLPIEAFANNLITTFNTLADFVSVDDWGCLKIIFLNHVSKAFVSSGYFNSLRENEKIDAINSLNSLRYVLELLGDLFTDNVCNNSLAITKYLNNKLLP